MKENDIIYEQGEHWICRTKEGTFEVYRKSVTHSRRCAIIGFTGDRGLRRAMSELKRREEKRDE